MNHTSTTAERLQQFMGAQFPGKTVAVSDSRPLGGGYSRVMTAFVADIDGERRQLVYRCDPPLGQETIRTRRDVEFELLRSLPTGAPAPAAVALDTAGDVSGTPGMVIGWVQGEPLPLWVADHPAADVAGDVARLAAQIHRSAPQTLPTALARDLSWSAYLDDAIENWRTVETHLGESVPAFRYIADWLHRNRPIELPLTLVHGDFQASNVMVGPDGAYTAVDWELAHLGDPREDLGYIVTMAENSGLGALVGHEEELCRAYVAGSGVDPATVTPRDVAYFSILSFGANLALLLRQVRAVAEGENSGVVATYTGVVVMGALIDGWVRKIEALS